MICTKVMGEDKSEKLSKDEKRAVLGDITNKLGKRGFSSISSSSGPSKSGNVPNKRVAEDPISDVDANFWKQVALVVENLEKERCSSATPKCPPKVCNESKLSPLKGGKIYRLQTTSGEGGSGSGSGSLHGNSPMGVSKVVKEVKEPVSALDAIVLGYGEGDGEGEGEGEDVPNVGNVDVGEGDSKKESCIPSVTVVESSKSSQSNCLEAGKEGHGEEMAEIGCTQESIAAKVGSSRSAESRDMGSFGLQRCTALVGDSCGDLSASLDLLKSCSCSFCTKAAYIWSDLHYQDVKGRISILMKSQKEASNLAQRYPGESDKPRHDLGNSSKVPQAEQDLTSQWHSLFRHMENIYTSEKSQLQANFLSLKDLREEYKTNLEMINGMPSDVQPSSSDASDHLIS